MKRVFVDTNIVIDLIAKRESFFVSAQNLFTLADESKIELCISSLTFANAYYSISRHHKDVDVKKYLAKFKVLVTVLPLEDKSIDLALASDFEDFEDAVQYYIALENNCEIIITRNTKDFKKSALAVMTASEYLSR